MSITHHKLLLSSLSTYYKKIATHRKTLKEIIDGKSLLSLRLIDWFVTHYARSQQVVYWINIDTNVYYEKYPHHINNNSIRKFNLYMEYRAQLQSYTKLFFDPFRRHERITFLIEQDPIVSIETTVGQLNFFRWAFQNNIFEYILDHLQHIEDTMATYQKQVKKQTKESNEIATATTMQIINANESANAITLKEHKTITTTLSQKNKSKKKEVLMNNIVLRTPCFIRFD
jgi:hypothetical protein